MIEEPSNPLSVSPDPCADKAIHLVIWPEIEDGTTDPTYYPQQADYELEFALDSGWVDAIDDDGTDDAAGSYLIALEYEWEFTMEEPTWTTEFGRILIAGTSAQALQWGVIDFLKDSTTNEPSGAPVYVSWQGNSVLNYPDVPTRVMSWAWGGDYRYHDEGGTITLPEDDDYITALIWGKYTHYLDGGTTAQRAASETAYNLTTKFTPFAEHLQDRYIDVIPQVMGGGAYNKYSPLLWDYGSQAAGEYPTRAEALAMVPPPPPSDPTRDTSLDLVEASGLWYVDDGTGIPYDYTTGGADLFCSDPFDTGGTCASTEVYATPSGSWSLGTSSATGSGMLEIDLQDALDNGAVQPGWWYALGFELTLPSSGATKLTWRPHRERSGLPSTERFPGGNDLGSAARLNNAAANGYRSFLFRIPDDPMTDPTSGRVLTRPMLILDVDAGSSTATIADLKLYPVTPHLLNVDPDTIEVSNGAVTLTYGSDYALVPAGNPTGSFSTPTTFDPYYDATGGLPTGFAVQLDSSITATSLTLDAYGSWTHAGVDLAAEPTGHDAAAADTARYKPDLYDEDYWTSPSSSGYHGNLVHQLATLDADAWDLVSPEYFAFAEGASEERGYARDFGTDIEDHLSNYVCRLLTEVEDGGFGTGVFSYGSSAAFGSLSTPYACPTTPAYKVFLWHDHFSRFANGNRGYQEQYGGYSRSNHVDPGSLGFDGLQVVMGLWSYGDAPEYIHRVLEDLRVSTTNDFEVWAASWFRSDNQRHLAAVAKGQDEVTGGISTEWDVSDPDDVLDYATVDPITYQERTGDCLWDTRWALVEFDPTDQGHHDLANSSATTLDEVQWRPSYEVHHDGDESTAVRVAPSTSYQGNGHGLRTDWLDDDNSSANQIKIRLHAIPEPDTVPPDITLQLDTSTVLTASASWPADLAVSQNPRDGSEFAAVEYLFQIPSTWGGGAGFWFWLENNCQVDVTIDGVSVYQSIPGPGYDSSSGLSVSTRFPQDPYGDACY